MRRSFYHYLLTQRGHNVGDPVEDFAASVAKDNNFPKQSQDYHELSSYLELNVNYLSSMDLFDQVWDNYQENNQ